MSDDFLKFQESIEREIHQVWSPHEGQYDIVTAFLIDWAEEEGADWIIFDDCDCIPNYKMKKLGRLIFIGASEALYDYIMVNLVLKDSQRINEVRDHPILPLFDHFDSLLRCLFLS